MRLRSYYQLTKPGIVYSNAMMAAAGFLFACEWHIHLGLLAATLASIALVIASACVINNYIDRGIDEHMRRTRKRALVTGEIRGPVALAYGVTLGVTGFAVLALFTNLVTVILGLIGYADYLVAYGYFKRHSPYGTLVGTISGSIPPAAGYTAVTGHFDISALLLFLILVFWQMPHFYAIAMYRFDDYKAAGLPVWPVSHGVASTKRQIVGYMLALIIACLALTIFGPGGYMFAAISSGLVLLWLWRAYSLKQSDSNHWGKQMFLTSLVVLLVLSADISLGSILP